MGPLPLLDLYKTKCFFSSDGNRIEDILRYLLRKLSAMQYFDVIMIWTDGFDFFAIIKNFWCFDFFR